MTDPKYFIVQNGKPEGPFSIEELRSFKLRASDFVKRADDLDYRELQEHKELSTLLSVPFKHTEPQYFASLDIRLLAWALDFLLVFLCYCIICVMPVILFASSGKQQNYLLIGAIGIPIALLLMGIFSEFGASGGTPGKRLLKIKVRNEDGTPVSFPRSCLRNLMKVLGFVSLGVFFFIGFFDRRQQCLHDKIARTLVVKDRLI